MTYHGRVQNGVVVLEGNPLLEEGTRVRVEPLPPSGNSTPHYSGSWHGEQGELERLLAEVQMMRDADLRLSEDATE